MRIDWYTKIVLTIIAVSLLAVWSGGRGVVPFAQAQLPSNQKGTSDAGCFQLLTGVITESVVRFDSSLVSGEHQRLFKNSSQNV